MVVDANDRILLLLLFYLNVVVASSVCVQRVSPHFMVNVFQARFNISAICPVCVNDLSSKRITAALESPGDFASSSHQVVYLELHCTVSIIS